MTVFFCLLTFASCGARLYAPGGLYINSDTLLLTWNSVNQADEYALEINGKEYSSRETPMT